MKKYFFTILFFSSISSFADNVSPQNYVNQVTSDCLAIENGINSLISTGADIPYIQDKISQILMDVQFDSQMSQSAKDYIINYCQQAYYRLNQVKSSLEQINRNSASIRTVASNLDLGSSGSGGSSVTNNYYYNSSTTNFYYNSDNNYYNSSTTNFYYTTDNNYYSSTVTNLLFYSSFVTNISNHTEVDLTGVLSYLSSIEGLDSTLVSNFSDFLVAYSNTVSTISLISLRVQTLNSIVTTFLSDFWYYRDNVISNLLNISSGLNAINNNINNINSSLSSISRSISSILSILPTWASRSILFYDGMSIWTNNFWNLGNGKVSTSSWASDYSYHWLGLDGNQLYSDFWEPFPQNSQRFTFYSFLQWYLDNLPAYFSSLNNYAYTNMTLLGTIANKSLSSSNTNSIDVSSITSSIYSATDILTNSLARHFTIFDNSSPLMDFHNASGNTTNQYYHFLTNYYIKVSTGNASGSASESHTNWFNRIEMLLGALVFRDSSDGSFTPSPDNTDGIEGTLDSVVSSLESVATIPNEFESTINNAERSILDYMREWHYIISSATLGSQFTLVDVEMPGLGSGENTRDASGRFTLSTSLEDGNLRSFLDVSRACTTVIFITLFLILSLRLLIFLLKALFTVVRVCFALYEAIFGH